MEGEPEHAALAGSGESAGRHETTCPGRSAEADEGRGEGCGAVEDTYPAALFKHEQAAAAVGGRANTGDAGEAALHLDQLEVGRQLGMGQGREKQKGGEQEMQSAHVGEPV